MIELYKCHEWEEPSTQCPSCHEWVRMDMEDYGDLFGEPVCEPHNVCCDICAHEFMIFLEWKPYIEVAHARIN